MGVMEALRLQSHPENRNTGNTRNPFRASGNRLEQDGNTGNILMSKQPPIPHSSRSLGARYLTQPAAQTAGGAKCCPFVSTRLRLVDAFLQDLLIAVLCLLPTTVQ